MNPNLKPDKAFGSARFFRFLLETLLGHPFAEDVEADLFEIFRSKRSEGRFQARLWLISQYAATFFTILKKNLSGSMHMFKSYVWMAARNLKKHRAYSAINIFGLALGLSAAILILLYLQFEVSFDRFHRNVDNLYRISIRHIQDGQIKGDSHIFTPPLGVEMTKSFPEVIDFVRMSTLRNVYMNTHNEIYKAEEVRFASPGMFSVFSFLLKQGDPATALESPFSLVLTEQLAARMFGNRDPLGETIRIGSRDLYTVTGVAQDPPAHSSIQFQALMSFSTLFSLPGLHLDWNGGNQYITFVQLHASTDPTALEAKLEGFMWQHLNEQLQPYGWKNEAYLQPLKKIHFYFDESSRTALTNFLTFAAVAAFILILACINFVNLTTARAARRAKEVGMRKVMGAHRGNLMRQFLGESILLTSVAFGLGLLLAYLLTPTYNQLLGKTLNPAELINGHSVLGLFGLILIVGIASGLHPAFYLSSFVPVKTLKGVVSSGRGNRRFRNVLVIFQFTVSVALFICMLLVREQIQHIKQVELGYDKENIVVLPLTSPDLRLYTAEIRTELMSFPEIVNVSASSDVPYAGFTSNGYIPEGLTQSIMIHALDVDEYFLETYNIKVVAGRNFSKNFATDTRAYLINQTLANQLDWENPIGKTIYRNDERQVIGVVRDFQFATLHNEIAPLLITFTPERGGYAYLSIKLKSPDLRSTLSTIESVHKSHTSQVPFEYFFLDDAFDKVYKSEERFENIFQYFSILAMVIALLGLLSLSAYSAQQKAREIGIRKVLGATLPDILSLFSREMLMLIVTANLLAAPLAVFVIQKWMKNFVYRADIALWTFGVAFLGSLAAALLTISYQSFKAALKKPASELRSE